MCTHKAHPPQQENKYQDNQPTPENFVPSEKPASLRLFLPWKDGRKGWLNGIGYNGSQYHSEETAQFYAIDFNLQPNDSKQTVYPTAPGELIYADSLSGGFGNTVILRHVANNDNYYFSMYAHLDSIHPDIIGKASKDEPPLVDFNQELGKEGMTGGTSTAAHLHFALFSCPIMKYNELFETDQKTPSYLYNKKIMCICAHR